MAEVIRHLEHLPAGGPLSERSADVELQLGTAVFPCHREYLESQSWVLQGLFESHPAEQQAAPARIELSQGGAAGASTALAYEAAKALQEGQLSRFLFHAYHPDLALSSESEVMDLLAAADFFSDDRLKAKCDVALAGLAAKRLKGLRDPLPFVLDAPDSPLGSPQLEDSATAVLEEHGSPVKPAEDEWDAEVHARLANNVKARDRQELVRFMRLACKFDLPRVTAQCLPHLCKLIVAASTHSTLRHTVQECLPLLDDAAKTVVLFEVAQLAAVAAGDEGMKKWELDAGRMLKKLRECQGQEAALSRHGSLE